MDNLQSDFISDFDEETERALDTLVRMVGTEAEAQDNKTAIMNPDKVQQVLITYKALRHLMKNRKGVKVTYALYEPYKSTGSVSVSGRDLTFDRPDLFIKASMLANNVEIYPKTDKTIQINFTFHGLTRPI